VPLGASGVSEERCNRAGLIYLGRPGRFRYTNQDHSLEMGITACQMIVEGRKYDLDAIGSENEYFEKGPVYEKRI